MKGAWTVGRALIGLGSLVVRGTCGRPRHRRARGAHPLVPGWADGWLAVLVLLVGLGLPAIVGLPYLLGLPFVY